MARVLNWLAKPWQAPIWFFILLLGFNRWILNSGFGTAGIMRWQEAVSKAATGAGQTLAIGLIMALCMLLMLKTAFRSMASASLPELFNIGLKAQSPYLLAAPLALAVAAAACVLGVEEARRAAELFREALVLAMFLSLYYLLRRRFAALGEFKLLILAFSPYLILIAAALALSVLLCSALILSIAYLLL